MLRIAAEGLFEIGNERLGFRQIQIAPFVEGVTLDIRSLGLRRSIARLSMIACNSTPKIFGVP